MATSRSEPVDDPAGAAACRLAEVQRRIERALRSAGRAGEKVTLIAVSKTHDADAVGRLAALGQVDFGENYLQEAAAKIRELADAKLTWHFIGRIQSNKCADIARLFDVVHSVDRAKVARKLGEAARALGRTIDVMVQVNVQAERGKSGVAPRELPALIEETAAIAGLRLRGLMAIPEPAADFESQRRPFAELRRLLEEARESGIAIDSLSMGMSADLEAAIAEGATHVRVGTALFGPRNYDHKN